MNTIEFNEKWKKHLEQGHYGLDIDHQEVINYLDEKFTKILSDFPNFEYSQIKLKFGQARVYMEPMNINTREIEETINKIIKPT